LAQSDQDNRMSFLEDVPCPTRVDAAKPAKGKDSQLQAMYDFDGIPADLPSYTHLSRDGYPMELKTTGEIKYELLKRCALILLRLIGTLILIAFLIFGAYCDYMLDYGTH